MKNIEEKEGVCYLLTALNKDGKLITLFDDRQDRIFHLRKHEKFFCPACKEPLILKAGQVRIPHFSHQRHSQCTHTSSEPESPRHLKGKMDLFEWCRTKQLKASLEHYLPEIRQRADLLVKYKGRQFAVEFQCTPISVQAVEKRTNNYLSMGITPIWIVGGLPFLKRRSGELFELTEYYWSLTMRKSEQVMLPGYEPENGMASLLTNITPFSSRKVSSQLQQRSLSDVKLPQSGLTAICDFPLEKWMHEKRNWVQHKVRYGNLVQDRFLQAVYEYGSNPFLLSPLIGLPVHYMECFISHPSEWQFFIWTDCLSKLKLNKQISLKYVNFKMRERIAKRDLICRVLPLHGENEWEKAVGHYFQLLEELFYFQKAGKDLYRMVRLFPWPENVEKAEMEERNIFDILMKNS